MEDLLALAHAEQKGLASDGSFAHAFIDQNRRALEFFKVLAGIPAASTWGECLWTARDLSGRTHILSQPILTG